MDLHGTRPLGVNWYRLLSIYSDLGKKSNSHEKICDIGTELQSFRADVGTAINGINTKLQQLIDTNKIKLSTDDLTRLKDDIVSGLKDHVQSSGERCAAPVYCNGDSVFFTEDVKNMLGDLVRQKAQWSQSHGGKSIKEALDEIQTCLGGFATRAQMEKFLQTIEQKHAMSTEVITDIVNRISTNICTQQSTFFTEVKKERVENALLDTLRDWNNLNSGEMRREFNLLGGRLQKIINDGQITKGSLKNIFEEVLREQGPSILPETVADAVAQKMGETDIKALKIAMSRFDPAIFDMKQFVDELKNDLTNFGKDGGATRKLLGAVEHTLSALTLKLTEAHVQQIADEVARKMGQSDGKALETALGVMFQEHMPKIPEDTLEKSVDDLKAKLEAFMKSQGDAQQHFQENVQNLIRDHKIKLSEHDIQSIASAVEQKVRESDEGTLHTSLTEMFEGGVGLLEHEKTTLVNTIIQRVWDIVKKPSSFIEELNLIHDNHDLLRLFEEKSDLLTIEEVDKKDNTAVIAYIVKESDYVDRVERFNSILSLTLEEISDAVKNRCIVGRSGLELAIFDPVPATVYQAMDMFEEKHIRDIGKLQYLHYLLELERK